MDKRYQVFVSSTYEDLKEERQEVIQALLELDCIPAGMELFPAADEDQWTLIKKIIDDCDYYIVVVGGRYGSISAKGISYTQMEYEYAISTGKPIIGFLHKEPGNITAAKTEQSDDGKARLKDFRELVQKKVCKFWSTPSELGSVVSRSLVNLIKTRPAIGWVRGNLVSSETASQEIVKLRKKIDGLEKQLDEARFEAPKGTEQLAQGDEKFKIHFVYDDKFEYEVTMTWNQISALLLPCMVDEEKEYEIKAILKEFLADAMNLRTKHEKYNYWNLDIRGGDFQTIKIQLRALGLIKQSMRPRSLKDGNTYWAFTPYGDNIVNRLVAVTKSST